MKKLMYLALVLCLMVCATTQANAASSFDSALWQGTLITSAQDGDFAAGIVLDDQTKRPVLVLLERTDGEVIATRYKKLLDNELNTADMRLEVEQPGASYIVPIATLFLRTHADGSMDYIRFLCNDQGAWEPVMLLYDFEGQTYDLEHDTDSWILLRRDHDKGMVLPADTLDVTPDGFSLAALLPFFRDTVDAYWEAQHQDALDKLSRAFPQEDWSSGKLKQWDWIDEETGYVLLAVVDRKNQRTVYLVDTTSDQPIAIRSDKAIPYAADIQHLDATYEASSSDGLYHELMIDYTLDQAIYHLFVLQKGGIYALESFFCDPLDRDEDYTVYREGDTIVYWDNASISLKERPTDIDPALMLLERFDPLYLVREIDRCHAEHLAGKPPIIPASDSPYFIPDPVDAPMKKGTYAVYSGPGKQYYREADGKASVSTNDWVQVFGREGDWALVEYRVKENHLRFGYVHKSAFRAFANLPKLSFEAVEITQDNEFVTSDPLGASARLELDAGNHSMTRLAVMGKYWMYVEMTLPSGQTARMFAEIEPGHG